MPLAIMCARAYPVARERFLAGAGVEQALGQMSMRRQRSGGSSPRLQPEALALLGSRVDVRSLTTTRGGVCS